MFSSPLFLFREGREWECNKGGGVAVLENQGMEELFKYANPNKRKRIIKTEKKDAANYPSPSPSVGHFPRFSPILPLH